jgi:hypothetical protein
MNIRTATPAEIDTQLADLYRQESGARGRVASRVNTIHRALGEKQDPWSKRKGWPTTDAEALDKARALEATSGQVAAALAAYGKARAELDAILAKAEPLHAEYLRRGGWSRFFTVQQNNGHIHRSMNCQTCNRGVNATEFGWNPELSGLTEQEAVNALGPILCTVCFPSAPLSWTAGRTEVEDPSKCSNRTGVNYRTYGMSYTGDCEVCGARAVAATHGGGLRKHTNRAYELAAERKARTEDPKLIAAPDGGVLKVGYETIRTVRAAEILYVEEAAAPGYSWSNPANHAEHRANALILAEALAAKSNRTVDEVVASLAARVARKIKNG